MAPPSADVDIQSPAVGTTLPVKSAVAPQVSPRSKSGNRLDGPLEYSGSLDSYESRDATNVIGREFPTLQLSEILHDDAKLRDLAVLSTF